MKRWIIACALAWTSACVCPPGQASCSGGCSNLRNDPNNCGRCGNRCADRCNGSSCVAPAECSTDADCDDGRVCTGTERCMFGRCAAGSPIRCNAEEEIACTLDQCTEPGMCTHTPVDDACPMGQLCDAELGCVMRCADDPCGLVPQCGCPEGRGCYATPAGRDCEPAGTGGPLDECFMGHDCEPGSGCLNVAVDPAFTGACHRLCKGPEQCGGTTNHCAVIGSFGPGVGFCAPDCNPVANTGCPRGLACTTARRGATPSEGTISFCAVAGPVPIGGTCVSSADCAPRSTCARDGSGAVTCRRYCRRATDCPSPQGCFFFVDPMVLDSGEIGTCA